MKSRHAVRRARLRGLSAGALAAVLVVGGAAASAPADVIATTTITGSVTREDSGLPVEGVSVDISDSEGGSTYDAITDANGDYTVGDLPAGEYVVRFAPASAAPDLVSEFWKDAADWSGAQRIVAVGGEMIDDIDASLRVDESAAGTVTVDGEGDVGSVDPVDVTATAGQVVAIAAAPAAVTAITGTVRADGAPAAGLVVEAFADGQVAGTATTAADGAYRLDLPSGVYTVRASGAAAGLVFAPQYYPTATTPGVAAPVELTADADRIGVNFDLARGGNIQGTVESDGGALPVGGAQVTAYLLGGSGWYPIATTTAAGAYIFGGVDPSVPQSGGPLPAGTYRIGVEAEGFCTQFVGGAHTLENATPFELGAGGNLTDLDVTLTVECGTGRVPTITLSPTSVRAGELLQISGTNFVPGTLLEFFVEPEQLRLGTLTADADGSFTGAFRIPLDAVVGEHYILARLGTSKFASGPLIIMAAADPAGGAVTPGAGLADTGGEAPVSTVTMALGLAAVGLLLMLRRGRRLRNASSVPSQSSTRE